jgi:hypothetical protein
MDKQVGYDTQHKFFSKNIFRGRRGEVLQTVFYITICNSDWLGKPYKKSVTKNNTNRDIPTLERLGMEAICIVYIPMFV